MDGGDVTVQNPVPRLITMREDHSAGLFLLDSDATVDLLQHVTSSAGLCVVESTNSFYWIDDVTGSLTAENYTSRVSASTRTSTDHGVNTEVDAPTDRPTTNIVLSNDV